MSKKKQTETQVEPAKPTVATCRIRLLVSRGGCNANGVYSQAPGEELTVPVSEAWSMFDAQQCVFVGEAPARPID